jgi:hypothetical protein
MPTELQKLGQSAADELDRSMLATPKDENREEDGSGIPVDQIHSAHQNRREDRDAIFLKHRSLLLQ